MPGENYGVRRIYQVDAHTLGIDWTDGVVGRWRLAELRRHCPCAHCVDEWTRERRLDPATISDDLTAKGVESVGRYALRISFGDGHDAGIYPHALLRGLNQAPASRR